MRRSLFILTIVAALGCGGSTTVVLKGGNVSYFIDNGGYFVQIDDTGKGSKLNTKSVGEGTITTRARHEIEWGDERSMVIEDGALTIDGKDRGRIERGARIHVLANGDVLVNDAKR